MATKSQNVASERRDLSSACPCPRRDHLIPTAGGRPVQPLTLKVSPGPESSTSYGTRPTPPPTPASPPLTRKSTRWPGRPHRRGPGAATAAPRPSWVSGGCVRVGGGGRRCRSDGGGHQVADDGRGRGTDDVGDDPRRERQDGNYNREPDQHALQRPAGLVPFPVLLALRGGRGSDGCRRQGPGRHSRCGPAAADPGASRQRTHRAS